MYEETDRGRTDYFHGRGPVGPLRRDDQRFRHSKVGPPDCKDLLKQGGAARWMKNRPDPDPGPAPALRRLERALDWTGCPRSRLDRADDLLADDCSVNDRVVPPHRHGRWDRKWMFGGPDDAPPLRSDPDADHLDSPFLPVLCDHFLLHLRKDARLRDPL